MPTSSVSSPAVGRAFAAPARTIGELQPLIGERYRLEHLAGAGGMGRVFAATDTVLRRRVAIKLLGDTRPGEILSDRIIAEARAMARLNHPGVCRVLEVVTAGQVPFIVMDWIDGIDLDAAFRGADLDARLRLFVRVVEAVAPLHSAGLVHRDLKPGNILVDRSGSPTVVDFGLARDDERRLTGSLTAGGTPGFAAPEQFEPHAETGPPTDVFGLGVILFCLLTDRRPFEGDSAQGIIARTRAADPPLPETLAPGTPEALQRICLAAMERSPSRRYPDAGAMASDLRRYLAGETVLARPSILADRFSAQIDEHAARAAEWMRLGLITGPEFRRLSDMLVRLQRPDSPWIVDSRRLTLSQVSLYLGGWIVLLALTIGTIRSWDSLWPSARQIAPWAITALLAGAGVWLHATLQRRISIGYLFTAACALPVAIGILLHESGWLSFPGHGLEASDVLFGDPVGGILNIQVLANAAVWLASLLWLRWLTGSGAFTFLGVMAAAGVWGGMWLVSGRLVNLHRHTAAEIGFWFALLGIAAFPVGLRLSAREHRSTKELGAWRVGAADAAPVLGAAVFLIVVGTSAMAKYGPENYFFQGLTYNRPTVGFVAGAFLVNGCLQQLLAFILERRPTPLRTRLADLLRWLIPSHFLGSILYLEHEEGGGVWLPWLVLLPVLSIALCYLSVVKQWKSFLFTGLAYLVVSYWISFDRLRQVFQDRTTGHVALMLGVLGLGLVTMALAWRLPAWSQARRSRT